MATRGIPTRATRSGVVEAGAHASAARGKRWAAIPGRIVIVNPDDAHDGDPGTDDSDYSYRMIYVDGAILATAIQEAAGRRVAASFFAYAVVEDEAPADSLSILHRMLERLLITALCELDGRHGGAAPHSNVRARSPHRIAPMLDYLTEHFTEDISLAALAALAGVDRFNLLRTFTPLPRPPPHLYGNCC